MNKVSDKPLTNPKDDKFGYAKFAEQFANAIKKVDTSECLVYALCGPWGSGKTSCVNFVQDYIKSEKKFKTFHFSPWWYSGKNDLLIQFFKEFGTVIGQDKDNTALLKAIIDYAVLISEFPEPTGTAKFLGGILKTAQKGLKPKDVYDSRKKLKDKLSKSKYKYLVIIDDIDRLSGAEIADIFKIVKAVADFPNVIYLLVYDKNVIKESLSYVQPGIDGEQYMEKIVQIFFDLPALERLKLESFFTAQMENIIQSVKEDERTFSSNYWTEMFHVGLKNFIHTPRSAIRLINYVKLTYPAISEIVNFTDFVTMQAIRFSDPYIYNLIMSRPDMFHGYSSDPRGDQKEFHESWITSIPENRREFIKSFLSHIFPKLKLYWDNHSVGYQVLEQWRKQKRVCSPECFSSYFNLVLSGTQVTEKEIKDFISISNNSDLLGQRLLEYAKIDRGTGDNTTRLKTILDNLPDYLKEIPQDNIISILKCFFKYGDEMILPQDRNKGLISWGNDMSINRLLQLLIEREFDKKKRFELIKTAMSDASSIYIICSLVRGYSPDVEEIKTEKVSEQYLEESDVKELQSLAVKLISRNSHKIFNGIENSTMFLIFTWAAWGDKKEVKRELHNMVNVMDYENFLRSMHKVVFYQKSSKYMDDDIVEQTPKLNTGVISEYFDLKLIFEKNEAIKKNYLEYLNMPERIFIELFDIWKNKVDKGEKIPKLISKNGMDER